MALATSLSVSLAATLTKALDLVTGTAPHSISFPLTLTSGTGANQADKIFSDQRSISANDSLDVAAGGLTDAFGDAFTIARVKLIYVKAASANTQNIQVTRPAANGVPWLGAAGDFIIVRPGGVFVWAAPDATGVAVTAGTGDLIDIAPASGTQVYDIVIIGASA